MRRNPLLLLLLPFWLLKGKAHLKAQIATRASIDIERLPYNEKVTGLIEQFANRGARVILATASHVTLAERIARHVGRFDAVLATNREGNLAGHAKLDAILGAVGEGRFAYVGNAIPDLVIWARSAVIYVVDPSMGVESRLRDSDRKPTEVFLTRKPYFASLLKALRPHQWLKNVLVFMPILAAQRLVDPAAWYPAIIMFVAYGLTASSVYLVNDLLDLDADREHARKRNRPFAAGDLPILHGLLIAPLLLASGLSLAFAINPLAGLLVLGYTAASTSYTFLLKRYVIIDALTLAGLYTLRILAGSAAAMIVPSFWLLAFSMFFFLSLATMKRAAELQSLAESGVDSTAGRDYLVKDLPTIRALGVASGYLSVLVLALYINAPDVSANYATPEVLWGICIVLLYWLGRLWIKTNRGEMHDDPVVYAITDWNSRTLGVVCVGILLVATLRWS